MGKRKKKLADSVSLQLLSLCNGNAPLMAKAEIVHQEFDRVKDVDSLVKNQQQQMLNKVLHSTRAMDTGMRTFLELFDAMPVGQYAMGPYLSQLRKGKNGCFGRLNGVLSDRIQKAVVDKRNKFLHAAGQYPTKAEAEQIVEDVESYLQTILNLV